MILNMKHIILLPTYNEAENIEKIIVAIFSQYSSICIMVIDDNSPDGTGRIVQELFKKYPNLSLVSRKEKSGLGKAYIHGFREVLRDTDVTHVIMMDADFSHDPRYLKEMMEKSSEYDLVVGSRYISGGQTVGWERWRKALSYYGNLYARVITRSGVHDLTGGFNCIRADLLRAIDLNSIGSSGYAFQIELKYILRNMGACVAQIPIIFVNRTGGESKISNHIVSEGILAPWRMIFRKTTFVQQEYMVCNLCEKSNIKFFTRKNKHSVYKCSNCGFLFVSPLPAQIEVYDKSYFSGAENGFGYIDYDVDKEPMRITFEKYIECIHRIGVRSGKLLDIGAATGFFMKIAQTKGFETTGVEISEYASQKGRNKGLSVLTGDLMDVDFSAGLFDVITMCDVLEHVSSPKNFLFESKRILKHGGLLVINTPDAGSVVAKFFGPRWHLIVPPEHLHYFSKKNLAHFLSKNGFEIMINTTIGKKFTLQYIFKTLYTWQKLSFWDTCAKLFSKGFMSKLYIPLNMHDNLFLIAKKK